MAYQSKPKLLSQEYRWLIDLVEKDMARIQAEHEKTPHPLYELRLANLQKMKEGLSGILEYEKQHADRDSR